MPGFADTINVGVQYELTPNMRLEVAYVGNRGHHLPDTTLAWNEPSPSTFFNVEKLNPGLVPYGEVWRTGANEATTFVTTADVMVGGTHVPAGSYTIFTIPNKDKWTLVISKKTGEWGTNYPGPENDLARIEMKASALPAAAENFTIAFDKTSGGCTLRIDWETTRASVEIGKM